jgi:hypothetical protein
MQVGVVLEGREGSNEDGRRRGRKVRKKGLKKNERERKQNGRKRKKSVV